MTEARGEVSTENPDLGVAGLTRRERLERIANAERDRRQGREAVAAAAIGEPNEWPARVVLALSRMDASDEIAARHLLEEGLDRWARDMGLAALDAPQPVEPEDETSGEEEAAQAEQGEESLWGEDVLPVERLPDPLDSFELDRAFAEAEADVEAMHDVNFVASRVLMEEPIGLAELSGEAIEGTCAALDLSEGGPEAPPPLADDDGPGLWHVPSSEGPAGIEGTSGPGRPGGDRPSRALVLATLERWLHNLERRRLERRRSRRLQ